MQTYFDVLRRHNNMVNGLMTDAFSGWLREGDGGWYNRDAYVDSATAPDERAPKGWAGTSVAAEPSGVFHHLRFPPLYRTSTLRRRRLRERNHDAWLFVKNARDDFWKPLKIHLRKTNSCFRNVEYEILSFFLTITSRDTWLVLSPVVIPINAREQSIIDHKILQNAHRNPAI